MGAQDNHSITLFSFAVIQLDSSWRIKAVNPGAEKMTGLSANELIGSPVGDILSSEGKQSDMLTLRERVGKGDVISNLLICIVKSPGKKAVPALATILPLAGTGFPAGSAIICMKDAADASHLLQSALNGVAYGIFTTDTNRTITSFNRAAEIITGRVADEALGSPCAEILHCNNCDGGKCFLQESISCRKQISGRPVFFRNSQEESVPVNLTTAPLYDDHDQVIGGIGSFHDTTQSLWSNLVLDSIADGVFTVDREWTITSFNKAAEAITGWTADEAVGRSCSEVFRSSTCGRNCAIAESLYRGTPVSNRSITILNREGRKLPVSISASPFADHEGNIIGGVETFRDLTTLTSLRREVTKKYHFDEMISKSRSMQRLFALIPEIANSPSTVLIHGESGTGKEMVARALYNASDRKNRPFVAINCGALPESLLEAELFGYKAGAFTDARTDREGRFGAAEGGTLFLDEIGDISLNIQVKLLRVLQEKVYEPLGSSTPIPADVRIITATNRDLAAMVVDGTFREDLYYRLNVVRIHLPPLRERKEDIPLLVKQFITEFSAQQGKDIVGTSNTALSILMRHNFPGNIRELKNIIEYAFILCEGGYILPEHLPDPFGHETGEEPSPAPERDRPMTLAEMERQAILLALENNSWKKTGTCEELGISKDTLRRKMTKYGIAEPRAL